VYARSTARGEDVKRTISFGGNDTDGNATYAPLCEDTFGQTEHLWASVPVYGPMLQVQVTCGQTATVVDMTIYAVREVS
jgi:hypothetical protein